MVADNLLKSLFSLASRLIARRAQCFLNEP